MDSNTGSSLNFEEGMTSGVESDDVDPDEFSSLRRQPSVLLADEISSQPSQLTVSFHSPTPELDDLPQPSAVRGYRRKAYNADREASHVPITTNNLFDQYQLAGKQIIIFVDWDNKTNIFTGDEQESKLNEFSDRIFFWNCCRSDFSEKHLKSKAVRDLQDHQMIYIDTVDCNYFKKNATDILIVKNITELSILLPVKTHLQIISDDKSFKVLENQMVKLVPCKDMFMSIFNLEASIHKTELPGDRVLEGLLQLLGNPKQIKNKTEVILFHHARPGNLPKSDQDGFQILAQPHHNVVILLFCKEKKKGNATRGQWYRSGQIKHFYTFQTSESLRDGSDFKLVRASTVLNYSLPVCVPFTLVSYGEGAFLSLFSQVKSYCTKRKVTVSSLKQLFDRFDINDVH